MLANVLIFQFSSTCVSTYSIR